MKQEPPPRSLFEHPGILVLCDGEDVKMGRLRPLA